MQQTRIMEPSKEYRNGMQEGIARCVSQMVTHPFEQKKIQLQVHGINSRLSLRGMFQASFASGLIYSGYFTLYNMLEHHPLASTISSMVTSLVKIPTNNSIRLFFALPATKTIVECGHKIYTMNGVKGLFTGFRVNILEDIIETNIRDHFYKVFKKSSSIDNSIHTHVHNTCIGAVAGSLAAGLTTPFDCIKSNLVYYASQTKFNPAFKKEVIQQYYLKHGILGLYQGCFMRMSNNAIRYALFYFILQSIL